MMRRRIFQWFTVSLVVLSIWMAYANVISDDTAVRAKARATLGQAAGCGDDCKIENLSGDRGMIDERIDYDVRGKGHYAIVCRRPLLVLGEHACTVHLSPRPTAASPAAVPSASAK